MNALVIFAICYIYVAQAKPGSHGDVMLVGVPNVRSYEKTHYPSFDIQDLGTVVHGEVPPKTIKIHESITVKEPQPYPVKVPHHVPYPVHIPKPYPVTVTKIVHVPHTVPVEVVKHVHVPVEVPKPYPVPVHEHHGGHDIGGGNGGGDWAGHNHIPLHGDLHSNYDSYGQGLGAFGHDGEADQSAGYPAVAPIESQDQGIQDVEKQE